MGRLVYDYVIPALHLIVTNIKLAMDQWLIFTNYASHVNCWKTKVVTNVNSLTRIKEEIVLNHAAQDQAP